MSFTVATSVATLQQEEEEEEEEEGEEAAEGSNHFRHIGNLNRTSITCQPIFIISGGNSFHDLNSIPETAG